MSKQQLGAAARLLPGSCCAAQLRQIESPGISLTSSGATVHQQQQKKKKPSVGEGIQLCSVRQVTTVYQFWALAAFNPPPALPKQSTHLFSIAKELLTFH